MGYTTVAEGFATLQATEDKTHRAQHKIGASATGNAHYLLTINGQIVAKHTKAKAKSHHVQSQQPATCKEETVE